MKKVLLTTACLLWCPPATYAESPYYSQSCQLGLTAERAPAKLVLMGDRGGSWLNCATSFLAYKKAGTRVELRGVCHSGCTLVTSLDPDKVCVTPEARLAFHYARYTQGPLKDHKDIVSTAAMESEYPSWVNEWIAMGGGLTWQFKTMGFAVLKRHYKPCPPAAGLYRTSAGYYVQPR